MTGEVSRKGRDSRSEDLQVSEASVNSKTADRENSEMVGGKGSRGRREPRSDGSRVSDNNDDSKTVAGKDSGSNVESEPSGPEDSEGLEGGRRRDSEGSSHNVGVSKSGIDEASRTDTASRDHNRSRLSCCDRSELEDCWGSRFRGCKLSELNVLTGEGWNPRAASDGNSELEMRLPSSEGYEV